MTIPLHFRTSRLVYFAEMIRTLADFPVEALTMMIMTNAVEDRELSVLKSLVAPYNTGGKSFLVRSVPDTPWSYDLCWAHRDVVANLFNVQRSEYTHFIYHEDDIRFSFQNFCYFLYGREYLRSSGLIPSFVRVEFNSEKLAFFSTDQWEQMDLKDRPIIDDEQMAFVPIDSVYNALYVLDHELAFEFVNSKSFDRERSKEISSWGIPERASLGLCVENIPPGYLSRYVVPVSKTNRCPATCSWTYHLPNTFTNNQSPDNPFGKLPIGGLFRA